MRDHRNVSSSSAVRENTPRTRQFASKYRVGGRQTADPLASNPIRVRFPVSFLCEVADEHRRCVAPMRPTCAAVGIGRKLPERRASLHCVLRTAGSRRDVIQRVLSAHSSASGSRTYAPRSRSQTRAKATPFVDEPLNMRSRTTSGDRSSASARTPAVASECTAARVHTTFVAYNIKVVIPTRFGVCPDPGYPSSLREQSIT
jgi:hypothetical protein